MTKKEPPGKRVPNGEDGVQEGEIPDLLNIIFNHRKAALQGFLRDRRQAFSGTQEKLRERVEGYLSDGSVRAEELVELLDRIEGWGNQHIYLYRAPDVLIERWNSERKALAALKAHGKEHLLNRRRPLVLPANPQLPAPLSGPPRGSASFGWRSAYGGSALPTRISSATTSSSRPTGCGWPEASSPSIGTW